MRPVQLTIQAFGPYPQRELIDFRTAVDSGIFGIYGQTGSGKSTLFSAMTFALFGEPARSEQDPTSLRSDHADPGLLTEVEFVFDIADKRYVVIRRPEQLRPKQRGGGETKILHEAFLFDATGMKLEDIKADHWGRIIAEKKVRLVDEAIVDLLGYSAKQFRQIVLLPQGRFETFLCANTKERLEILRELFDVSTYRNLTARLKAAADTEERSIRETRDLFAARLDAEGYESSDALTAGIEDKREALLIRMETEVVARQQDESARTALTHAQQVEAKFNTVRKAAITLEKLRTNAPKFDAQKILLSGAERAALLADVEARVIESAAEVTKAETAFVLLNQAASEATALELVAGKKLIDEQSRTEETEEMRVSVETFARHEKALTASASITSELKTTTGQTQKITKALAEIEAELKSLLLSERGKREALKSTRLVADQRQAISERVAQVTIALRTAQAYERANLQLQKAARDHAARVEVHENTRVQLATSETTFAEAERALSTAQALHLATKLQPGEPCLVCGAKDHPMPAQGTIEDAGRNQAFLVAKSAMQLAQEEFRVADNAFAAAASLLRERQNELSRLEVPAESSNSLQSRYDADQELLASMEPELDLTEVEVEAEADALQARISSVQGERDDLREALTAASNTLAAEKARLDQLLLDVPKKYQELAALQAEKVRLSSEIERRRESLKAAEQSALTAREIALATRKDVENAQIQLGAVRSRHEIAAQSFVERLQAAGLTEEAYLALKPAILEIDAMRHSLELYRQEVHTAEEQLKAAQAEIELETRLDVEALQAALQKAQDNLRQALEESAHKRQGLAHLEKLRAELEETVRRLDEAESASGTLRQLAGLFEGKNGQNLDLETFAIGSMFDQVLETANLRLGPMSSNRYRLEREIEPSGRGRRGLGVQAYDNFTGKGRPANTLSGGETFIFALALALGLADVVESESGKVRLDTIFIDEGFGSLDTENGSGTLDQVLRVLSNLVSQHRAVGLISHVPLVQEAIPNGFYVRKSLTGSRVEMRGD